MKTLNRRKLSLAYSLAVMLSILVGCAPAFAGCHNASDPISRNASAPDKKVCCATQTACHCVTPSHAMNGMSCACLAAPSPSERTLPPQVLQIVFPATAANALHYNLAESAVGALPDFATTSTPRASFYSPAPPRAPPFQG